MLARNMTRPNTLELATVNHCLPDYDTTHWVILISMCTLVVKVRIKMISHEKSIKREKYGGNCKRKTRFLNKEILWNDGMNEKSESSPLALLSSQGLLYFTGVVGRVLL